MNRKRIVFTAILIAPIAILFSIAVLTVADVGEIRGIKPSVLTEYYRGIIAKREPVSFTLPDIKDQPAGSGKRIFVFGSSDLLLSEGDTFPSYLEKVHPGLQAVNFGVHGIDSFLIRQRIEDALAVARPDVIVVYYGHNEYNGAYQGYVLPEYFDQFGTFMKMTYAFHLLRKPAAVPIPDTYYWHTRLQRHAFFAFFERLGLIEVRHEAFAGVNRLILDFFVRNHTEIIRLATTRRIPIVFITPIANLHAEPWGSIHTTTALFRKGLQTGDYEQAIDLLTAAKDSEIFSYDLRAKSELLLFMRASAAKNVHVLDLERILRDRRFGFGHADFLDYSHLSDRTHHLIADVLFDFLEQKKIGRAER